jgi:hypothetical protein
MQGAKVGGGPRLARSRHREPPLAHAGAVGLLLESRHFEDVFAGREGEPAAQHGSFRADLVELPCRTRHRILVARPLDDLAFRRLHHGEDGKPEPIGLLPGIHHEGQPIERHLDGHGGLAAVAEGDAGPDLEVVGLGPSGEGREQGHLVGEESRATGREREIAASGLDGHALPGQLDFDLPELAVVFAPRGRVGDLVVEAEVGRDLLQPLAQIIRVRDQQAARAFGKVAQRARRVEPKRVLGGVEGLDLVAGDGAFHAGVLEVAGGGGLPQRRSGGGEIARGVEAAHVHAVDADACAVGLADGRPEETVEIRGDPEAGREEDDRLAAGQLFLGLEQREERPERRLALLLALDEIGRPERDGLDLGELPLGGYGSGVAAGRTDVTRAGGVLRAPRLRGSQEGGRRDAASR